MPVPLDAGDFSLIDRRVVDALNNLPETNRFLRGLRAWVGFRQIGVPYHRPERMFGKTTNSLMRNIGWARKAIFSFSYIPLEMITVVGLLTTIAAFVAIAVEIVVRIVNPAAAPTGFTTVIVLILFVGGIQLLCLSVIGSYLAHIYEEVKRRPPYIVADIRNRPSPARSAWESPEQLGADAGGDPRDEAIRCLVTGAAGFVGANLVRRLIDDGHDVSAILQPLTDTGRLDGLDRSAPG